MGRDKGKGKDKRRGGGPVDYGDEPPPGFSGVDPVDADTAATSSSDDDAQPRGKPLDVPATVGENEDGGASGSGDDDDGDDKGKLRRPKKLTKKEERALRKAEEKAGKGGKGGKSGKKGKKGGEEDASAFLVAGAELGGAGSGSEDGSLSGSGLSVPDLGDDGGELPPDDPATAAMIAQLKAAPLVVAPRAPRDDEDTGRSRKEEQADMAKLAEIRARRDAQRRERIAADGWDRFAPVTADNYPPGKPPQ